MCRPHSLSSGFSHHQRPSRSCWPGSVGRVELRGSLWSGRNRDAEALEPGTRVRVESVDGLLLHVRRESPSL